MEKLNGNVIAICTALAFAATIATGFMAYGAQGEKVKQNKDSIEELKKTTRKIHEIDRSQAQLQEQVKGLDRAQRTFRRDTTRTLERILNELKD